MQGSCPLAWCSWQRITSTSGLVRAGQLANAGRLTVGSSPIGAMVFQRHVAGSLHRPFVVMFEQDGPDETDDGVFVGEDADHLVYGEPAIIFLFRDRKNCAGKRRSSCRRRPRPRSRT